MFGWLKKWTGGARETDAPPEIHQAPMPEVNPDNTGVRISAPLLFRRPANIDPFETMFGIVRLSRKDETWPSLEAVPLAPLLQVNLTRAPVVPDAVRDLALITIFISKEYSSNPTQIINSQNPDPAATWVLRSYGALEGLTIPRPPINQSRVMPLLGEWGALREEHEVEVLAAPVTTVIDGVEHHTLPYAPPPLTKLGGCPRAMQSAPWWADPALPDIWDFVMQIENETKAGWFGWGSGAACIARSRQRPHLWAIDVQQRL